MDDLIGSYELMHNGLGERVYLSPEFAGRIEAGGVIDRMHIDEHGRVIIDEVRIVEFSLVQPAASQPESDNE